MCERSYTHGRIAADAFEAHIESAIIRADDLYQLDSETFLKFSNGRVELIDIDLL